MSDKRFEPSTGHWYRPMVARRPEERDRVSTRLELLFDLCFVVAVSQAAAGPHHSISQGHVSEGVLSYLLVFFAIWWAWMNFTPEPPGELVSRSGGHLPLERLASSHAAEQPTPGSVGFSDGCRAHPRCSVSPWPIQLTAFLAAALVVMTTFRIRVPRGAG